MHVYNVILDYSRQGVQASKSDFETNVPSSILTKAMRCFHEWHLEQKSSNEV